MAIFGKLRDSTDYYLYSTISLAALKLNVNPTTNVAMIITAGLMAIFEKLRDLTDDFKNATVSQLCMGQ